MREHRWTPDIIGSLFFDNEDYCGLFFWYQDVVETDVYMCNKPDQVAEMERAHINSFFIDQEIFDKQRERIRLRK